MTPSHVFHVSVQYDYLMCPSNATPIIHRTQLEVTQFSSKNPSKFRTLCNAISVLSTALWQQNSATDVSLTDEAKTTKWTEFYDVSNNGVHIWSSQGHASLYISIVKPTRCTNVSNLFYFGMTLHVSVFPSIIRSSRLYTQHQAFVNQILVTDSIQQYLFDKCLVLCVELLMMDG